MSLTTCGEHETLKTTVHVVMLVGATTCCAYNAAAWLARREPHSAVNAVIYGALAWLECQHVQHHWAAR